MYGLIDCKRRRPSVHTTYQFANLHSAAVVWKIRCWLMPVFADCQRAMYYGPSRSPVPWLVSESTSWQHYCHWCPHQGSIRANCLALMWRRLPLPYWLWMVSSLQLRWTVHPVLGFEDDFWAVHSRAAFHLYSVWSLCDSTKSIRPRFYWDSDNQFSLPRLKSCRCFRDDFRLNLSENFGLLPAEGGPSCCCPPTSAVSELE